MEAPHVEGWDPSEYHRSSIHIVKKYKIRYEKYV